MSFISFLNAILKIQPKNTTLKYTYKNSYQTGIPELTGNKSRDTSDVYHLISHIET